MNLIMITVGIIMHISDLHRLRKSNLSKLRVSKRYLSNFTKIRFNIFETFLHFFFAHSVFKATRINTKEESLIFYLFFFFHANEKCEKSIT